MSLLARVKVRPLVQAVGERVRYVGMSYMVAGSVVAVSGIVVLFEATPAGRAIQEAASGAVQTLAILGGTGSGPVSPIEASPTATATLAPSATAGAAATLVATATPPPSPTELPTQVTPTPSRSLEATQVPSAPGAPRPPAPSISPLRSAPAPLTSTAPGSPPPLGLPDAGATVTVAGGAIFGSNTATPTATKSPAFTPIVPVVKTTVSQAVPTVSSVLPLH